MNHPRIGVTWCGREDRQAFYERAIAQAGGEVVRLYPDQAPPVGTLDGLVLTGGSDVDPAHYGQARLEPPALHDPVEVDEARDALELALARAALELDIPLLGICRGIQVLNVAAGGALVQDLKLLGLDRGAHYQSRRDPPVGADRAGHAVRISSGTLLGDILGAGTCGVNTFHHQAVDRVAEGFVVSALAPDEVIEAVESPVHRFALGVQWHPELMVDSNPAQGELFRALVKEAAG